jgi:flagellar hook-associated protein 3 FlgL
LVLLLNVEAIRRAILTMAGFLPVPTTRSSGLLVQTRLLAQLHADQLDILRLQTQISTGRRIARPSEDAPAAQRGQTLQRLLELKAQAQINIQTSQSYLDATDTALAGVTTTLSSIRALAVEAASDTSTAATRQAAAEEVRRAIEQLVATANQNFRGRYLFAGSRSSTAPFVWGERGVIYLGNEGSLDSFVDLDLPYATNASGAAVFGTFSSQVQGSVDLNPVLTADTPLADLYGGRGLALGSIQISDGTNKSVIDLSLAATIGDVAALIEAHPPAGRTITAQITATGLVIDIDDDGGGNLTIKEVAGGTTAKDLQILSPIGTGVTPVVGGDLNPRLRLTTPLADLLPGGPQLDLAAGLQITNGGQTFTIDTSGAVTIEDLLNAINGSDASAVAEIAPGGERIVVRSRLSGADFAIGENGGSLATQLGLRSLTADTLLADLNHGLGVSRADGTDFSIVRKDGTSLAIDIGTAATIGDVIDLINSHPANLDPATRVVAGLAAFGNGIELFDGNTVATGQLQVNRQFGSSAAWDLGLIPLGSESSIATTSASGDTLTGSEPNPQEVSGVFNSLLRLHDALVNFDRGKLERAVALLDDDFDRVNFARGEIGARNRTLDTIRSQLEDEQILLQSNLSDEIDTDLAEAIANLAARQAALQASLQLAAQLFRTSLLDFL